MLRILGEEITVNIVRGGVLETTLTSVMSFNSKEELELKKTGYLGETADRVDQVYKSSDFDMNLHLTTADFFAFKKAVREKAQRKTPNLVFNISRNMFFSNGQTVTSTWADCAFGPFEEKASSRADYFEVKISGSSSSVDDDVS